MKDLHKSSKVMQCVNPKFMVICSSRKSPFYGEDVEESDFSTVTPWSSISGPRTSRLSVVLKTLGGATDRRLKALVTWSRSSMYFAHHVNLQVTGSPLISHLDRPTKV